MGLCFIMLDSPIDLGPLPVEPFTRRRLLFLARPASVVAMRGEDNIREVIPAQRSEVPTLPDRR